MIPLNGAWHFIMLFIAMLQQGSLLRKEYVPVIDPLELNIQKFQTLYQNIGDSTITPDSAEAAFKALFLDFKELTQTQLANCEEDLKKGYVFPVRGYPPRLSIGGRGRGYRPKDFNFFDSRIRKSHPAHDLFIRDRDNDGIDDVMCIHVDILAYTSGLVLGIREDWTSASQWRGGNYVWIYNPCLNALIYYAHFHTVDVKPGQWVKAGDILGKMGRTGFNAQQPRSTTHLHFMYLNITKEGLPEPVNTYTQLLNSRVIDWWED